jgi:hypothetical protein
MSASTRDPLSTSANLEESLIADPIVDIPPAIEPSELEGMVKDFMESLKNNGREAASTKMLAAQIILAFVGAFAGFLYRDPAAACAEGACDDEWLAKLIESQVFRQYLYFLSGFIGFGSTNCTFSYYGPQELAAMLARLDSLTAKAVAVSGVAGLVLLQGVQIYMAAQGTGSAPFNMALTVMGSLPGAINGAVGMLGALPKMAASLKETAQNLYDNYRVKALPPEKRTEMAIAAFYKPQRQKFDAVIAEKWKAIVAHVHEIDVDGDDDLLTFLLNQETQSVTVPWYESAVRKFMQFGVGGTLTAAFSAPMLYNSYTVLGDHLENPVGRGVAAAALCSTTLYGNVALTHKLINTSTDIAISKLKGEPIDSLVYQLRPWTTRAMLTGSIATALFSYAVVDMMFNSMWGPSNPENPWGSDPQAAARAIARAGIIQYHITGPMDVGTQMLAKLLKNGTPKEKYLAKLQLFVNYTAELSQREFIRQIENNVKPAERDQLHVQLWSEFIEQVKGMLDNPELFQTRLKEMGLEEFSEEIVALTKPKPEVSVSASAQHWQSSSYLLSPKSSSSSPRAVSVVMNDERSVLTP